MLVRCGRGCSALRPLASSSLLSSSSSLLVVCTQRRWLGPPRGTRDFVPKDMRLRSWLFGHWREVARRFGFEEYDGPVVESEELYTRKEGEDITNQLFNFEDKSKRRLALRPELTPTLARLVAHHRHALTLPIRWFAIGQCWRYERMTRGRKREHYQWNMDVWGADGVDAEAEVILAVIAFLKRVGLTHNEVQVRVSSRAVLRCVFESFGVTRFMEACMVVDKLAKLPEDAIHAQLADLGCSVPAAQQLTAFLKTCSLADIATRAGAEGEALAIAPLRELLARVDAAAGPGWVVFDPAIVRGLSYYTGMVFEVFDTKGELRAVAGGGRYDNILDSGLPAVGFGFGDVVIMELLSSLGRLPQLPHTVTCLVCALDNDLRAEALRVANVVRDSGTSAELVLETCGLSRVLSRANAVGARFVVGVGKTEWEQEGHKVLVRDMVTRSQTLLAVDQLPGAFE